MGTFSLHNFQETNTNTKKKVFVKWLFKTFGVDEGNEEFDNSDFSLLNENDLIDSLKDYIRVKSIGSQQTAKIYIGDITSFFDELANKYNIENEVFTNTYRKSKFVERTNEIISELKETESKDIASDEQYEKLNTIIDKYLSDHSNLDLEISDEFEKYKITNTTYLSVYQYVISIIAFKFVMEFAFKDIVIISLNVKSIDIENKCIHINDVLLPLDDSLEKLLKTYLKIRNSILDFYSMQENLLFIKYTGEPYIQETPDRTNTSDYGTLFKFSVRNRKKIVDVTPETLASKRIVEMINSGIDISIISDFTKFPYKRCKKLQEKSNRKNEINEKLKQFFNNKEIVTKKRYLKCPFCGDEVKASSDYWILFQNEGNKTKYLRCRKCVNDKH